MNVRLKARIMATDGTEHQQKIEHRTALLGDHFSRHQKRDARWIGENHIGGDTPNEIFQLNGFHFTFDLLLPGFVRREFHFRQDVKRLEHQPREIVLTDQLMDPLRQILNPHIPVIVRIFGIQVRQHIFDPQIEIVSALKFHQSA
ncbi:hypothetical protein D3C78_1093020 [compost metagenome]